MTRIGPQQPSRVLLGPLWPEHSTLLVLLSSKHGAMSGTFPWVGRAATKAATEAATAPISLPANTWHEQLGKTNH